MPPTDNRQHATANELAGVQRLLRASAGRKTRFHTMRGELVPLRAAAELPWLIVDALVHREPDGPWINAPALRFLKKIIRPDWRVFECGAGRSTVWYAQHAASVLALEDLPSWHAEVVQRVARYPHATVELLPAAEFPARIGREPDGAFDLVVVDGNDHDESGSELAPELSRPGCVQAAMTKVRPGGVLLLDNSDLPQYRQADGFLAAWPSARISGFSSSPLTPWETSFYWRPNDSPVA